MQRSQRNRVPLIIGVSISGLLLTTLAAALNNESFTKCGDVEIHLNATVWKCDKIVCPTATDHCHVSKENSPNSPSLLIRKNICYSKDGEVLLQKNTEEPNDPKKKVSLMIDTYRSGTSSLNDNSQSTNQVQQNVEDYIRRVNQEIAQQMKNLRHQITSSILSSF